MPFFSASPKSPGTLYSKGFQHFKQNIKNCLFGNLFPNILGGSQHVGNNSQNADTRFKMFVANKKIGMMV
jgi:hypothetical protein